MLVVSLKSAKNTVPRVELISQIRLLQLVDAFFMSIGYLIIVLIR